MNYFNLENRKRWNKKGSDGPSMIFAIVSIFIIGIIFLIFSYLFSNVYSGLQDSINSIPSLDNEVANQTLTDIQVYEQSMWDYAFLFILIGYVIVLMTLAFTTQANPHFYIIFIIIAGVGLFLGVALSNAWEKFAEVPLLSSTVANFPITDTILNNFFPLFIAVMFACVMVMLFGKRFLGSESEGGLG